MLSAQIKFAGNMIRAGVKSMSIVKLIHESPFIYVNVQQEVPKYNINWVIFHKADTGLHQITHTIQNNNRSINLLWIDGNKYFNSLSETDYDQTLKRNIKSKKSKGTKFNKLPTTYDLCILSIDSQLYYSRSKQDSKICLN